MMHQLRVAVFRIVVCASLVLTTQLLLADAAVANDTAALSTHVLNITLSGATNGWPQTDAGLAVLSTAATATVCGSLPSTVDSCAAFLMSVYSNIIGLQVRVDTSTMSDSSTVYTTLSAWASNSGNFPLSALQTSCATALGVSILDPLTFRSGQYIMPCRTDPVYSFLPMCATGEESSSTVYIANASGTSLQTYFTDYLCANMPSCTDVAVTVTAATSSSDYTVVTITNAAAALEAILQYVSDVRSAYFSTVSTTTGVSASAVQMRYNGMSATLFSTTENVRSGEVYKLLYSCHASSGYWAFALIAIFPILLIMFRYVWYRGRHRAKRQQRKLIIADETRIMQGYTNIPAGADSTAANYPGGGAGPQQGGQSDPPPGVDYQRTATQETSFGNGANGGTVWMMDADGNYYQAPVDQWGANETPGTEVNGSNQDENGTLTAAHALHDQGVNQYDYPNEETAGDDVTEGAYQTYVDPNTGEVYQYQQDAPNPEGYEAEGADGEKEGTPAAAGWGTEAEAADGEAGDGAQQLQTYVDPETGETYQYDPNAAEGGEAGENADANGLQTYVDPTTGETYQYDPAAAEGQETELQTYVDPETGETYQYDPNAAENDADADGLQTYVDPATGETYQYDPNAAEQPEGGVHTYVDPNTGETYEYDPSSIVVDQAADEEQEQEQ